MKPAIFDKLKVPLCYLCYRKSVTCGKEKNGRATSYKLAAGYVQKDGAIPLLWSGRGGFSGLPRLLRLRSVTAARNDNFVLITALLILFLSLATFGNRTYAQDTCSEKMIIGETNLEALQQIPEFWTEYRKNYDNYSIDEKKIEEITKILNDKGKYIYIIAVIGTWCGDTKEQFPVFQKIIDHLQLNNINIRYIGVNRDKLAGETNISYMDIKFVPTFIFVWLESPLSGHHRELGRIVETPESTMEEHILKILSGKE